MRVISAAILGGLLAVAAGPAKSDLAHQTVKVGVLADMTSLFADVSGKLAIESAKMAIEAVGGQVGGAKIEMIFADTQNKADVASSVARRWFDVEGVDVIIDLPNSAAALAVSEIGRTYNKPIIVTTAGTSDLTGKACSPTTIHWSYNTDALSRVTASALVKGGGRTWFMITADYAFGSALERDATKVIQAEGGQVLGSVKAPINTVDFSSYLVQAQSSGAQVLGLANAGQDSANAVKGAHEFGLVSAGQKIAGFLLTLPDIHALGDAGSGLYVASAFYWNTNEQTRAYATEAARRAGGGMPDMFSAGVYSGLLSYFKAVEATGTKDGLKVVEAMKAKPFDDPLFGKSYIRPNGRVIHDMYLFETKAAGAGNSEWDLYQRRAVIPGDEAFGPADDGTCKLSSEPPK